MGTNAPDRAIYYNAFSGFPIIATVYMTLSGGFPTYQDAVVYNSKNSELRTDGCFHQGPSNNWGEVGEVIGDLPRLPAGGLEGAPVELSVLISTGALGEAETAALNADSVIHTKSVQVVYRPVDIFPT